MAASFELWSFVNKLSQLLDCGVRAEMHVTSNAGKIAINLNAEVESSTILQQSNNCVRNKFHLQSYAEDNVVKRPGSETWDRAET